MRILCLDLVMNETGYAIFENLDLVDYGLISTSKIKEKIENIHSSKLSYIYNKLINLKEREIDIVIIEDSFVRHNKATKALSKVRGVAELVFSDKEIILYPTRLIKKEVTGNGNADKEDMIKTINKIYCLDNKDDNIADAIALGYYYLNKEQR